MPDAAIITFVPAKGLDKTVTDYLSQHGDDWEKESQIGPFLGTEDLDPLTEACRYGEAAGVSRIAKDGEWQASLVFISDHLFDSSNLRDWSEPPADDPTDPRGD